MKETKLLMKNLFGCTDICRELLPNRDFPLDGLLVYHIGLLIAKTEYDLSVFDHPQLYHDAADKEGRLYQVRATTRGRLSVSGSPDFYLGLKLYSDGCFKEVYKGPGDKILSNHDSKDRLVLSIDALESLV